MAALPPDPVARNDVFVSYKREDEVRVGRLVDALGHCGLRVWWDRALPAGERWRQEIESALDAAGCVVVVWTTASVGATGGFVQEEAARAVRRGILVPVSMDAVDPPLGFAEIQAADFSRWRGSRRDPALVDLVATIRARLAGRPAPAPLAPLRRLRRRLLAGTLTTVALGSAFAFATNALNLQNGACAVPLAQPFLSDGCAVLGLGARPTRAERVAWGTVPPGNCAALRRHLRQFPQGRYRDAAAAMLSARVVTVEPRWVPAVRPLRLVVGRDAPALSASAARTEATERGRRKAESMCRDFGASGGVRFRSAEVEPEEWWCDARAGGVACGFEGRALCALDELEKVETEACHGVAPG